MKKLLTISFIHLFTILIIAFRYTPSENSNYSASRNLNDQNMTVFFPPPEGNISNEYLIGAMDCGSDLTYSNINDLGLNVWHKYVYAGFLPNTQLQIWGWNYTTDLMDAHINTYRQDVRDIITVNNNFGMRTLMERPKTTRLAFGQRSDYQCESKEKVMEVNPDLWFYAFNNNDVTGLNGGDWRDNTQYGNNQWVRQCLTDPYNAPNGQGYVVRRLMTNSEQCNTRSPIGPIPGDNVHDWYIKPSIRADKIFVNNPLNYEEPICRIDIVNYEGNPIKSIDLKSRHFKPGIAIDYDGYYKEEFNFAPLTNQLLVEKVSPYTTNAFNPNHGGWAFNSRGNSPTDGTNKMDIRVYWYGTCNMWIDYVRVDNDVADRLLRGNDQEYESWLQWEAQDIAGHTSSPLKFYIEEFEFNHIPCMAYVSQRLKQYSGNPNFSLMSMVNLQQYLLHLPYEYVGNNKVSARHVTDYLINRVGESQVLSEPYALTGVIAGTNYNDSKVPITLPLSDYNTTYGRLGEPVSAPVYEGWLQDHLDAEGTNIFTKKGLFTWYVKTMDTLSKMNNISYINMPQTHLWYTAGEEALREPTNEEMEMTTLLPVTYGAKGTLYFMYTSWGCIPSNGNNYGIGLTNPIPCNSPNPSYEPRLTNVYGQQKWEKIKSINQKLTAWGPAIMSFNNAERHSYIYRLERNDLINETYFTDIKTFTPDINDMNSPSNIEEPAASRYLQAAVFKKFEEPYSNYFMFVNRRCSPYFAPGQDPRFPDGENGGRRYFKVSFKESELQYFTNWKIVDLENNTIVTTFNKNGSPYIDLGWYLPGEGKLYKLVPVMVDGGTLAYDENLNMTPAYECYNTVYNGGKNISLYPSNNITFTHLGRIVMNGGSFQSGQLIGDQGRVTLHSDAIDAPVISFENCADVRIYNTDVSCNFNSSYLFSITNCTLTDIQNSIITAPENAGGIGFFAAYSMLPPDFNLNISNDNHFNMASVSLPALSVLAFGGVQIPLICTGNYFTSQGNNSSTAVNLLNVSGGVLQYNTITGFCYGVNALTTNTALYHNNISSSVNTSYGLYLTSGTVVDMSYTGDYLLGTNNISNTGSTSSNIYTDNSYYLMNTGYNIFNISASSGSYHLSGTFPLTGGLIDLDNKLNCFKQNQNNSTPVKSVNWYGGGEVQFNFLPYSCNDNQEEDGMAAADMGDGIIDSIAFKNGTPLNVYDSLGPEMRKRNYTTVINMCTRILNDPPDTIQIIDAVSKLYMATISTDTTETGMTSLKDFYLNVIMNNPSSSALVRNCNYYVQKCKVNLHQYSSAMSGFQQIITENPYSYEALVAHWDYMAVYILDSLSGGSEQGDGDDKNSKLTKEQKVYVKEVIKNTYENERTKEENYINKLVAEVYNGNEVSKVILEKKRTLKEVVQNQTPHNFFEHISIVNSDIKKVFGKSNSGSHNSSNNIPAVFRLSQNYPNPFNPETKINYDLPKDSKVKIVIYDILGREVKRLVNNELKTAGSYIVDFNASNYASGVYFYRIEAEEPNGNKFVDSKKMVLLK